MSKMFQARHKKRGTTYDVLGDASLQTETPTSDMACLVVYRCRETGRLWARRKEEFYDGRFEIVEPNAAEEEQPMTADELVEKVADAIEREVLITEMARVVVALVMSEAAEVARKIHETTGTPVTGEQHAAAEISFEIEEALRALIPEQK